MSEIQPRGWNSLLVDWFIRNTQVALLAFLVLVIGGIASLASLRAEGFPSPEIKVAVINTLYVGASPAEIERTIVKPLEVAINDVKGVSEVRSTASASFGSLQVSFKGETDFNSALSELRNKVQDVVLPADAEKPTVFVPSFGGNISYVAITTDSADATTVRSIGNQIRLALESVDGVQDFKLSSPVEDQVRVSFDENALAAKGLSALSISNALKSNNVSIPGGIISANGLTESVVTNGSLQSVEQLSNIMVAPGVMLSDVAKIETVAKLDQVADSIAKKDAQAKEGSAVIKKGLIYQLIYADDHSVIKVSPKVNEVLAAEKAKLAGTGNDIIVLSDVSVQIHAQIEEIAGGAIGQPIGSGSFAKLGYLLGGIWLIMLAMLVFVNWRAALISAFAVPLSLLFTFISLQLQGVSLNTLTLFSLVLVLGLIVDPAIVVIEAIQRQLDLGKRGKDAVIAAVNTVGSGVYYAVLTSVIVFVPFGVVSGTFGQIIKYIPITIIPALIASYLVPMLFLSYLARFLKPSKNIVDDEATDNLWAFSRGLIRLNTWLLASAGWGRKFIRVGIIVGFMVISLGVTGYLFGTNKVVPVQFSAPHDGLDIAAQVEYPTNFTKEEKAKYLLQLEQAIIERPEVHALFLFQETPGQVLLQGTLVKRDLRNYDSPEIVSQLNEKLKALNVPDKGVYMVAKEQNVGTPQSDFPVAVTIYGDDLAVLKKAAIATGDLLRSRDDVTRVEDGYTNRSNPQIEAVVSRDAAAKFGLPAVQIAAAVNATLGETKVTRFEQAGTTYEVLLTNALKPADSDALKAVVVGVGPKGPITLGEVAEVRQTDGVSSIDRVEGQRYVTVKAQVKDAIRGASAPQQAVKDYWTSDRLTEYGLKSDALKDRGATNEFLNSFKELFIALGVSIILLYIVLVFFLKSMSLPFIILYAVPLTFLGVFPALTLVGGQFGFLEILGIITLSGIVVNVAIFLLDQANQKRAEGMPTAQAIAEATGIRFRAIFLTKATALGGLLPLAILAPFWRSLAVVVIAGILVSGFLSLVTTPILYSWMIGAKERISRGMELFMKRFDR